MMSRRVVIAEIAIGVLAIFMVAEAAATIRLTETAHGARHAFVGELIQVGLNFDSGVTSSDESVVKPIGTTNGSPTVHYFVAALPGKALLRATSPQCSRCLALLRLWAVEIDVG
jgi:hypothetical protein